ncbi:beta-1,6-N-acetylglucosaminyltransferase [Chitinophaga sp. 212800010-3]|uniref:beta-1,6-N-acetylglucosaminyltransferase n=1 Tax=unclassified Chitinophaga TaxID=2619133 RepID=UPI002DF41E3E|nr:Glycosyltransferase [Chitinophaga sp. 212800010-3]
MKLAFIILCHKNPAQLARLLDRLQHPQVDCFVHLDAKANLNKWRQVLTRPQVYLVPDRVNVTWAGYGTIQAALNGISAAVNAHRHYSSMHLISAQDYPLTDISTIYHFFSSKPAVQFLDLLPDEGLQRMMGKITGWHFEDLKMPGKYRLTTLLNKLLPKRRHPLGLTVYGGSLWWSLSSECATWCMEYINSHPQLKRFYKYTWGGDEFIFQTVIMNGPYRNSVINDHCRYIDWSEGHAHPKTFSEDDLERILSSGKLFARKFDMDKTPALLDRIDEAARKHV